MISRWNPRFRPLPPAAPSSPQQPEDTVPGEEDEEHHQEPVLVDQQLAHHVIIDVNPSRLRFEARDPDGLLVDDFQIDNF